MKKLLAIAVAAALAAPAAMAETTLYGNLRASVGTVEQNGADSKTTVESHFSRFGVKGSTELDNGLSATYGLEYGVDLDGDSTAGATTNLTTRNQFVGLKGSFGEFRVGKHDTPHKLSTSGLDNFGDTYGDSGYGGVLTERRVNNAVAYINKFGPVGVAVAHSSNPLGSDDMGAGNANRANSLMLNYSNSGFYAGLGYEAVKNARDNGTKTGKNAKVGLGFTAQAGHNINVVYEKDQDNLPVGGAGSLVDNGEGKALLVGGGVKFGAVKLKAQYGKKEFDAGTQPTGAAVPNDYKVQSIGADYSLGKKTTAYILGHQRQVKNTDTGDMKATVVGIATDF